MSIEISPHELNFESLDEPAQRDLTLINKSRNAVTYRFRLQSNAVSISHPKGVIEGSQSKTFSVNYDPKNHPSKEVILTMQLKYLSVKDNAKEQTKLIPIRFLDDSSLEDELFKTPLDPRRSTGRKWWQQ